MTKKIRPRAWDEKIRIVNSDEVLPQRSLTPHVPDLGYYGDCFRTCLAVLLEKKAEEVPHFGWDGGKGGTFWNRIDAYLLGMELAMVTFPYVQSEVGEVMNGMKHNNPDIYYMLGCATEVADHVVVCLNGRIICDPATDIPSVSLLKPDSDNLVWVYLLVNRRMIAPYRFHEEIQISSED